MKINAKVGGVNTKWAAEVGQLLKSHFKMQQQASRLRFLATRTVTPNTKLVYL